MEKIDETFMSFDKPYHQADIVYFGAPFDGTASFKKGAFFGPKAIREDSYGLETYSPYQDQDLETDTKVVDVGDLNFSGMGTEAVLDDINEFIKKIINDDKIPLMVGGEHLVSYPVVKALKENYPDLAVIHYDAHMDLRYDYEGDKLSHATVMRRIYESIDSRSIYQFGIRSGTREEFAFSKEKCHTHLFEVTGSEKLLDILRDRPVYITIDLDVLDPGIFSGTGTQEPGGVTFKELLDSIINLDGLNIVGADVVELAPNLDNSGVSTSCACKVVREMAIILSKSRRRRADG